MADDTTVADYHESIKQALAQAFPALATVDDYPVEEGRVTVPAAFLSLASVEPDDTGDDGTERLNVVLRWELYLVLGLPTAATERAARTLATAVAVWVDGNRFGLTAHPAAFLRAAPEAFAPNLERHTVWMVEFEQSVALGSSVWEDSGTVPTEVYLGFEPDVGPAHVDDYVWVVGDELFRG